MSFLTIVGFFIGVLLLIMGYAFRGNWAILMNYKVLACLFLAILNIVFGVTLNFYDFFFGSPSTLENFLVTIMHLAGWIICFGIAYKAESKGVLVLYAIFWALTSAIAALTAYINSVETTVDFAWAIPIAMLLLPQWFGLNYLVEDYFVSSMIVLVMSLIIFSAVVWRWKKVI